MLPRNLKLAALAAVVVCGLGIASPAGAEPADRSAGAVVRLNVRAIICDVFKSRCAAALRVARCETGGTFNPRARGRAGERGLFQIHPVHFGWLDERRLFEPRYNARIAFRMSSGGRNWGPWTCKP